MTENNLLQLSSGTELTDEMLEGMTAEERDRLFWASFIDSVKDAAGSAWDSVKGVYEDIQGCRRSHPAS